MVAYMTNREGIKNVWKTCAPWYQKLRWTAIIILAGKSSIGIRIRSNGINHLTEYHSFGFNCKGNCKDGVFYVPTPEEVIEQQRREAKYSKPAHVTDDFGYVGASYNVDANGNITNLNLGSPYRKRKCL